MSFVASAGPHIPDIPNLSGGRHVRASAAYSILNSATLEVVGRAPLSTRDDELRCEALAMCADILDRHIDELSRLLSLEQGKPVVSAAGEIKIASRICR